MSNSLEISNLNSLINQVKMVKGSMNILDKAVLDKDETLRMTSLDAVNFRVREIAKLSAKFGSFIFSIDSILDELSNPTPSIKKLHDLMDTQLETLRKMALSEILNLSVE